jgi:hypothetical protein
MRRICEQRHPEQQFIRQAVGFAIRKGIAFDGHADVTALMLCNPQRRSSVDITIRPSGHAPIRLPSVHLMSGCFFGNAASACPTLLQQVAPLEEWIDAVAIRQERFPVLGDWNPRLALPGDSVWLDIDDGTPANADLSLADQGTPPGCDPRYGSFVDPNVRKWWKADLLTTSITARGAATPRAARRALVCKSLRPCAGSR